jgi:thymidylate kinase
MLVIKNVVLEGPDCSGKSTLYSNIHKSTKFKWNIQDRSQLSMLCYARQFNRGDSEVARWRRELKTFLLDLNNRLIVLLPDFQVIAQRLSERGDDVQDIESLRTLYSIFKEEIDRLGQAPNLLVVRNPMTPHDLMQHCVFWLTKAETLSPLNVAREVRQLAGTMPNREAVGCKFQLTVDPSDLTCTDSAVMRHPPEETYYAKILAGVIQNVEDEIAGRNEYCSKQDQYRTRRFIFTQSSCISLVHTMLRGDSLNMKVYCRSSNVEETFRHDLQFICYLYGRVYARLATKCGWSLPPRGVFTIDVELGSAHIVRGL